MIDKFTGKKISEADHIKQSISTILLTVIGSRIMRRVFGSYLFELVDSPATARIKQITIAVIAHAIVRWEPRVRINNTTIDISFDGKAVIETRTSANEPILVEQALI